LPSKAETDFAGGASLPTRFPPATYLSPDGKVDWSDLGAVIGYWYKTPPWHKLDVDMTNPYVTPGEPTMDHFIDVFDVAKVAADYGK
jgi:hypothetical protein